MTLIHIVLFKFLPTVSSIQKGTFLSEAKKLRNLPSVKSNRLIVGGPSVSNPIHSSKGYEFALVSYHEDQKALAVYQGSEEHLSFVNTYLYPYKEDVVRFDFEVPGEDENLLGFLPLGGSEGNHDLLG